MTWVDLEPNQSIDPASGAAAAQLIHIAAEQFVESECGELQCGALRQRHRRPWPGSLFSTLLELPSDVAL